MVYIEGWFWFRIIYSKVYKFFVTHFKDLQDEILRYTHIHLSYLYTFNNLLNNCSFDFFIFLFIFLSWNRILRLLVLDSFLLTRFMTHTSHNPVTHVCILAWHVYFTSSRLYGFPAKEHKQGRKKTLLSQKIFPGGQSSKSTTKKW